MEYAAKLDGTGVVEALSWIGSSPAPARARIEIVSRSTYNASLAPESAGLVTRRTSSGRVIYSREDAAKRRCPYPPEPDL
jgi:hypothetical protein